MGFGSLGISELLVIFVIVLVFFGPKRMPEVARSLGSAMREFRRSLNQIQRELEEADPTRELRKETKDILSRMPEEVRPRTFPGSAHSKPSSPGAESRPPTSEPAPGSTQTEEPSPDPSPPESAEPRSDVSEPKPGSESG
jgi:sec-independent protein translocase protein TatA